MKETYDTRVLVVDPDPVVASLHAAFVEAIEGLAPCGVASTAGVALALARLRRPDLVLIDLSLPGPEGLLRELRPLPVVGLSSGTLLDDVAPVYRDVSSFLLKPFLFGTFRDHIEAHVRVGDACH